MNAPQSGNPTNRMPAPRNRNGIFWSTMIGFGGVYLLLIVSMIAADFKYVTYDDVRETFNDPNVRYSIGLSLTTCTIAAILSMWVAIPTGFVLTRLGRDRILRRFSHRPVLRRIALATRYLVDTILDIPIVLPPLVVGISLLVLFQTAPGRWVDQAVHQMFTWLGYPGVGGLTYEIPAIVLAQFTVSAAFAIRTMRDTFEQMSERPEQVALTLGASHYQAFSRVAMPQAWRGCIAAFTLAWARSLGEFGPVLIFAGTARMKTEVLATTVYLNFQFGNLRGAVAASLILVTVAIVVLLSTRLLLVAEMKVGRNEKAGAA